MGLVDIIGAEAEVPEMNVGVVRRGELEFESGRRVGEDRHAALEMELDNRVRCRRVGVRRAAGRAGWTELPPRPRSCRRGPGSASRSETRSSISSATCRKTGYEPLSQSVITRSKWRGANRASGLAARSEMSMPRSAASAVGLDPAGRSMPYERFGDSGTIIRAATGRDDAGVAELGEVEGDHVLRLLHQICEFADTVIAATKLGHQPPPQRIAQQPEDRRRL